MSIFTLATALKYKNRDFQLHFKLAKLLEEKLFFENIYGSEKEVCLIWLNLKNHIYRVKFYIYNKTF